MKDPNSVKAGWTLDNEIVTVRGHRRGAPVLAQSVPRHRRVTRYSSFLFTQTLLLLDHHYLSVISTNGMADPVPQSDVSRPSALPTANLLQRPTVPLVDQNSNEYSDGIEEEWNKKVDTEIDTLVDGMVDLVGLASVSGSPHLCDDGAYSR